MFSNFHEDQIFTTTVLSHFKISNAKHLCYEKLFEIQIKTDTTHQNKEFKYFPIFTKFCNTSKNHGYKKNPMHYIIKCKHDHFEKLKLSGICKWFIWIYMSGKINIHEGLHLCSNKSLPIPLSNKQCQSQMSCQIQFELACCEIVKNLWQILSTRHLLCWSVEMDKHCISAISAILEHVSWLC